MVVAASHQEKTKLDIVYQEKTTLDLIISSASNVGSLSPLYPLTSNVKIIIIAVFLQHVTHD